MNTLLTNEKQAQIAERFDLDSPAVRIEPFGTGHINETLLVTTQKNTRYILQRISPLLTKDVDGLMKNIRAVTDFLETRISDPRGVMRLIPTKDGHSYAADPSGNWRVYAYIENSVCLLPPQDETVFCKSGIAFGHFVDLLKDFPAETLLETIPDFHNTPFRFRQFHDALREDRAGRKKEVRKEIEFLLAREKKAGRLQHLRDAGELPVRVTHNDTKLDNILFDRETLEPLCVIDLDTVMPGLVHYDFGDSIRSGAATAPEDEKDLDKVALNLHLFEIYREGFLKACPSLTLLETELLPAGAWTITVEQGARFLTDYLNGDPYYHTAYPDHNLVRCRTQLKLVSDMEKHPEIFGF